MKFSEIRQKIESSDKFKEFIKGCPEAYLYTGFFIIPVDLSEQKQRKLDYFMPNHNKIASFDFESVKSSNIQEPAISAGREELKKVNLGTGDIKEVVIEKLKNERIKSSVNKIIAVVNSVKGQVRWTISCFLFGMKIAKMYIADSDKSISEFEIINMMDLIKVKKMSKK